MLSSCVDYTNLKRTEQVSNRHQWGEMGSAIVADDAYNLDDCCMFPLKIITLLVKRQHCFTKKSWAKISNMPICQIFQIVTSICYSWGMIGMQRGCNKFMHISYITLQWRRNGRDSVSNHQPRDCLLRLFRRRSNKTSKFCVTGLCAGKSPGTVEFPVQMVSNAENVFIDDVIMAGRESGTFTRVWEYSTGFMH